ncbi:MAG TPA: hypothetical protein VIW64_07785 [Pyrinomonadaceae bacterium]|jgi:hypothetical protein
MWKYIAAGFFVLIGALEILLAFNGRVRDELMKNSPMRSARMSPVLFFLAGVSAFGFAVAILFYNRWF